MQGQKGAHSENTYDYELRLPYFAKSVALGNSSPNTLLPVCSLQGLLEFGTGLVGLGALASVVFLRGGGAGRLGNVTGQWPDDEGASEVLAAVQHPM